jgi:hypothetical protein
VTLYINHEALNKISSTLTDAGVTLEAASASVPKGVDGGNATPAILGILAHLTDNAGQLVVAVNAVGSAIDSANNSYLGQDEQAAEMLETAMETE